MYNETTKQGIFAAPKHAVILIVKIVSTITNGFQFLVSNFLLLVVFGVSLQLEWFGFVCLYGKNMLFLSTERVDADHFIGR